MSDTHMPPTPEKVLYGLYMELFSGDLLSNSPLTEAQHIQERRARSMTAKTVATLRAAGYKILDDTVTHEMDAAGSDASSCVGDVWEAMWKAAR